MFDISTAVEQPEQQPEQSLTLPYTIKLGRNIFLHLKEWQGEVTLHFRVFIVWPETNGCDEILIPTRQGVSFTILQMASLLCAHDLVSLGIEQMTTNTPNGTHFSSHIGSGKYIRLKSFANRPYVDIRQYWKTKEGEIIPTKRGVLLTGVEYLQFVKEIKNIRKLVPELDTTMPCFLREDHQNQVGYLECKECNPFTDSRRRLRTIKYNLKHNTLARAT